MKLTKGKLSKLFNKKKQSHKKKNHKRKSHKRNTFRNKKNINLANKTFKKFKVGGDPDEVPTNIDQIVPSVVEDDSDISTVPETVVEVPETVVEVPEEVVVPEASEEARKAQEFIDEEEARKAQELVDAEASEEARKAQELVDAEAVATAEEARKAQEVVKSETLTEIPSNEIIPDEVNKSINILADLLASKIVAKIQGNSSSSSVQNGFKSVDNIANVLGSSTGGSKYKTKRFKLTKKRKTRRSK